MDETITTPAAGAAGDPARERRIIEFLRGDPGVRLPDGFRAAVELAIAADAGREAPGSTRSKGRRSTWMLAAMLGLNVALLVGLVVIPRCQMGERPDDEEDPAALIDLQARLIEQQHVVIKHLKTLQEHDAVAHDVAIETQKRDMLTEHVAQLRAVRQELAGKIDGLEEREARLLAELTVSETKRLDALKRLVDSEAAERALAERLAQGPGAEAVERSVAEFAAERASEEAAGAARLLALDRAIREAGGDPAKPPVALAPVVDRERGQPWGVAAAKVLEVVDGKLLIDAGKTHGVVAGTRFLAYHEGFGGALAYRGQIEVFRTLDGMSEARGLSGAFEPGLLLYNPLWRRAGERAGGVRVAIAGPTPGLDLVRPRFEKALAALGATLTAQCDERAELVLVERDYADDAGFKLAHDLRLPLLHVARLSDYLDLPALEPEVVAPPTAAFLALERDRLGELLAVELAEGARLRGAVEGLGPRMKALSQGSRELASARSRLRAEIARRTAHLRYLEANPKARDGGGSGDDREPPRDDRQGMLDALRPDGRILCRDVLPMTVRIDRGREQRLVVGLVFEAYRPLLGGKRTPRARLVVTKVEAREAIARVIGRYHEGAYLPLPNDNAVRDLPAHVRTALFDADPLGEELIASALYDPDRPRVVVILGQLRGRWGNLEVRNVLGELGDRVVEVVDDRVDCAIAGSDFESDPRCGAAKRLGVRLVSPAELYGWLGGE